MHALFGLIGLLSGICKVQPLVEKRFQGPRGIEVLQFDRELFFLLDTNGDLAKLRYTVFARASSFVFGNKLEQILTAIIVVKLFRKIKAETVLK